MASKKGRTLRMECTEPQARFMSLTCKFPAFIAGFGSGKSETLLNCAILDAMEAGSKGLIGIYEPVNDLIDLIIIPRLCEKLDGMGIPWKLNQTKKRIDCGGGMASFIMRSMDNPVRIVGYETMRAHIDEIDVMPEKQAEQAWIKIMARNRQKPASYQAMRPDLPLNRISAYSTPEGFKFAFKKWKKDPKPGYEMIQASTHSNPWLPDDYVSTLRESYPHQLIDAYLEGNFVNLTSGTIYNQYDRQANGCNTRIRRGDELHIGMDFNVTNMSAVVHVMREEVHDVFELNDNGEYVKVGEQVEQVPHAVAELTKVYDTPTMILQLQEAYGEHQIYVYPDASGSSRKSNNASTSDISQLEEAGFYVIADDSNPPVRNRIMAMNAMFCNGRGQRRYRVNEVACPTYADCLEQQVWDEKGEPDKKSGNDHCNDAAGYFIYQTFPVIRPVANVKIGVRG